jgi:hypothetical protein
MAKPDVLLVVPAFPTPNVGDRLRADLMIRIKMFWSPAKQVSQAATSMSGLQDTGSRASMKDLPRQRETPAKTTGVSVPTACCGIGKGIISVGRQVDAISICLDALKLQQMSTN